MRKNKTRTNKDFPLQVGRAYKVTPYDYWLDNYSEAVELLKIGRRGKVTVAVTTESALIGVAEITVRSESLLWSEV